jgi:dihydroxy-acid dehydratase
VDADVLAERLSKLPPPVPRVKRGWLYRYARMVSSADKGAVMQVLTKGEIEK